MGKLTVQFKDAQTIMQKSAQDSLNKADRFGRRLPIATEPHWYTKKAEPTWLPSWLVKLVE